MLKLRTLYIRYELGYVEVTGYVEHVVSIPVWNVSPRRISNKKMLYIFMVLQKTELVGILDKIFIQW